MKISRILLFMLGVLLGLSALCVLMPEEGILLGSVRLEFPSLLTVFSGDQPEEVEDTVAAKLSPEELLEQRMASLKTQKIEEFRQFAESSPQRIYLPGGDETYLDAFFQSLEEADSISMRILHLGDSQLECDRISSSLREHYQQEFGGSGVGLVPALQTVSTYTLSQHITNAEGVGHYLAYGPGEMRASHNRYGVMAQVNHVHAGTAISLSARDAKDYPHAATMRRITVMAKGEGGMSVYAGGTIYGMTEQTANESLAVYSALLPHAVSSLSIRVNGEYDIYGIQLDDIRGVSFDNVPMRGCSGTIFTRIDGQTMAPFLVGQNVRLIILQYGGNSVPNCSSAKSISGYMTSLRKQIRMFRRLAPDSKILFIGPADMATRIGGEMKTWPVVPEMVDSLREMSLQEGVAFWDMFSAMGGKGAIVKWYRAVPQLAGGDFIHFTPKGAQKMADMLYGTLQLYYRFYRLRMGKEGEHTLRNLEFEDAVAPVEGNGTILISELPPRPEDSTFTDEEYLEAPLDEQPAPADAAEGNADATPVATPAVSPETPVKAEE